MDTIIKTLFEITIYSSVMIVGVLAMKAIWGGRISSKIVKFLWLLVLVRLLFPVTFDSPLRIQNFLPEQTSKSVQDLRSNQTDNQGISIEPKVLDNESNLNYPSTYYDNSGSLEDAIAIEKPEIIQETFLHKILGFFTDMNIIIYIFVLWMCGVIIYISRFVSEYFKFNKLVKKSVVVKTGDLLSTISECKKRINIDKDITVKISRYVRTPITFKIKKPVIILPVNFVDNINGNKLRMILMHELCHIKRHDIFINTLWLMAKTIHWFNPLVWIAYRYYLEDIELSCDEFVLKAIGSDERYSYSQSLIEVIKLSKRKAKIPTAAAFCEDKTKIRKRVENMIQPKKKLKTAGIISIIMAIILIVGCFTTACRPVKDETVANKGTISLEADESVAKEDEEKIIEISQEDDTPVNIIPAYSAPENIKHDLSSEDGKLNVKIEADIKVPEAQSYPIYSVESEKITQEEIDNFLNEFFPEREAVATSEITQLPTKENYQRLIDERKEWIATNENSPNEQGLSSHEMWQKEIDFYMEQKEDAPDVNLEIPEYDITKFSTIPLLEVFWDAELTAKELAQQLEESKQRAAAKETELIECDFITNSEYTSSIYALRSNDPYVNTFWLRQNNRKKYSHGTENYNDIQGLELTYEKAKAMAQKAVSLLGQDYMDLNYASADPYTSLWTKSTQADGFSYHFIFTRDIGGANVTYTQNIINNPETDYRSWAYNYFEIWIDDDGINKLTWYSSSNRLGEMILQDANLMAFDDIMEIAIDNLQEGTFSHGSNTFGADQMIEENRAIIYDNDIEIDKITLGYMRVTTGPEDTEYKLIPVWDFIGRESIHIDIKNKKTGEYFEREAEMPNYTDNHSFLTINAQDGSIIDRRKGY